MRRAQDALGHHQGGLGVDQVRADHHELVTAEAAQDIVGTQARLQPAGHGHQDLIAGAVAEAVVDHLQVVEVDEQDGELRGGSSGRGLPFRQQLHDRHAVGEAGERITAGLAGELGLHRLLLGDVAEGGRQVGGAAGVVGVGLQQRRHRDGSPAPVDELDLAAPRAARHHLGDHERPHALGLGRREQVPSQRADHLAEHATGGGVGLAHHERAGDEQHAVRRLLEDLQQALRFVVALGLIGDVVQRADDAGDLAESIVDEPALGPAVTGDPVVHPDDAERLAQRVLVVEALAVLGDDAVDGRRDG